MLKKIVVTGASSGIGKAITDRLLKLSFSLHARLTFVFRLKTSSNLKCCFTVKLNWFFSSAYLLFLSSLCVLTSLRLTKSTALFKYWTKWNLSWTILLLGKTSLTVFMKASHISTETCSTFSFCPAFKLLFIRSLQDALVLPSETSIKCPVFGSLKTVT